MMRFWKFRLLAALLCLCLLPAGALGESAADGQWPVDDDRVTRSDFTLSLGLNADAFPPDGQTDFSGWQTLLGKLSLSGTVDSQRFPRPYDRVYFTGGVNLNGKQVIPFLYEGYHSYRYVRSPALNNRSVHFQMNNFFEFMLKPYYFLDIPTQYLALLLYPEATAWIAENYEDPLAECFQGSGNRVIPYETLYELCEAMDAIAADDWDYNHVYFYLTALLVQLQASDTTFDRVCYLEDYLDYLDPEQEGLTVTQSGATESYAFGDNVIFTRTREKERSDFVLTLSDEEGYTLKVTYAAAPGAAGGVDKSVGVKIATETETRVELHLELKGLPAAEDLSAMGSVRFAVTGSAFERLPLPIEFQFQFTRSAAQPPCQTVLGVDWIHPVTHQAALSLNVRADVQTLSADALQEHEYDNQNDFFHLNEDYLEELKTSFALPLTLAVTPIALETPAGVMNDLVRWLSSSGLLATLGIE